MASANGIRAGMAYVEITTKNSLLVQGLKKAQDSLKNFANSVQMVGGNLLRISGMFAVPATIAIKAFAEFDDQMKIVKAISGATNEELIKLTETARNLGATTAFTATQVAQGEVALSRMGFAAEETNTIIKSFLDLTRATGEGTYKLGEVAMIGSNAMRIFGMSASDSQNIVDAIAYTVNNSSQSIDDLGQAFKMAGMSAKSVGENYKDVLASLAILANAGIRGELAGTALRKMYDGLAKQAVKANAELKQFGVTLIKDNGNLRKSHEIFADFLPVLAKLGTAEKLNIARDIFDLRGSLAGLNLTEHTKDIVNFRKALEMSNPSSTIAGYAHRTAMEMESGIGGTFRMIMSRINDMSISIGDALNETFKPYMDGLTGVFKAVREWIDNNKKLVAKIIVLTLSTTALGIALVGLGLIIRAVAFAISPLIVAFSLVHNVIIGAVSAVMFMKKAWGSLENTFTIAKRTIVGACTMIANGFKGILSSASFIANLTRFKTGAKAFASGFIAAFNAIKSASVAAGIGIDKFFGAIKSGMLNTGAAFKNFFGGLAGMTKALLAPFAKIASSVLLIGSKAIVATALIIGALALLGRAVSNVYQKMKEPVKEYFAGMKDVIVRSAKEIMEAFKSGDTIGALKLLWTDLKIVFLNAVMPIDEWWQNFKIAAYSVCKYIGMYWDDLCDGLQLMFWYVVKGVAKGITYMIDGVMIAFNKVMGFVDDIKSGYYITMNAIGIYSDEKKNNALAEIANERANRELNNRFKWKDGNVIDEKINTLDKSIKGRHDKVDADISDFATKTVENSFKNRLQEKEADRAEQVAELAQYRKYQEELKDAEDAFQRAEETVSRLKYNNPIRVAARALQDSIQKVYNEKGNIEGENAKNKALEKLDGDIRKITKEFEQLNKSALSDRVLDDNERKRLRELTKLYGTAMYKRNMLFEIQGAAEATQETIEEDTSRSGTIGSFFAGELSRMFGSNSVQERTAVATEETARAVKEMNDAVSVATYRLNLGIG